MLQLDDQDKHKSEQRLAHLGKIVLYLFPKLYHFILENISPASKWTCSNFRYNNDLRAKLSEDEKIIVDLMETDMYSKFSLRLCYKFFRYHHWFNPPGQTWGKAPTDTDVSLADDIERVRQLTNIIVSTTPDQLDEDTYLKILQEVRNIIERVESDLGKNSNILSAFGDVMEESEVSTLIENLYQHTVIEDDPFPSNPITEGRNRYARLCLLVVDIFPDILRKVVHRSTSASTLYRQIQRKLKLDQTVLDKYITHEERISLESLRGSNYSELDFSLIYKLIRGFDLLDEPTQGWGKQPKNIDIKISDDIERLRRIRNLVTHKVKPNVTENAMNAFFEEVIQVTQRIDMYLKQDPLIGFEDATKRFRTSCLDCEMEQKYITTVQEIEKIQARFTVDNKLFFYYGKSFKYFLEKVREEAEKDEKKKIVLVLEDFECDTDKVTILNEMKESINAEQIYVKFERATTGSLVLFIDIVDTFLSSDDKLGRELNLFVYRILQHINCESLIKEQLNIAVFNEEECMEVDLAINDIGLDKSTDFIHDISDPGSLCFKLNVDSTIFKTDDGVRSEIGGIVKRIFKWDGSKDVPSASGVLSYDETEVLSDNENKLGIKTEPGHTLSDESHNLTKRQRLIPDSEKFPDARQLQSTNKSYLEEKPTTVIENYKGAQSKATTAIESFREQGHFFQRCNSCNKEPYLHWCYECEIQLCNKCNITHQRSKNASYHHVQYVEDKYKPDYSFAIKGLTVRDIKVNSDGLVVIGNRKGKQLIVCNMTGEMQNSIDLPGRPDCIALVDNSTVAVTIPASSQLVFIDIKSCLIVKHVNINVYSAVTCIDNHLFLGSSDHSIKVLTLSGEIIRSIPLNFKPWYFCGSNKGSIYCTDREKVYCTDTDGNVLFVSSPSEIIDPCSIAIDDSGHVLVVCHKSSTVHKISPDGIESQVILKQIPSGWVPYICYHELSKLLVLGRDEKIHVYSHLNAE